MNTTLLIGTFYENIRVLRSVLFVLKAHTVVGLLIAIGFLALAIAPMVHKQLKNK